jgi:hypothetical protein
MAAVWPGCPAGERILGYSAEEIQAMSVREFFTPRRS